MTFISLFELTSEEGLFHCFEVSAKAVFSMPFRQLQKAVLSRLSFSRQFCDARNAFFTGLCHMN